MLLVVASAVPMAAQTPPDNPVAINLKSQVIEILTNKDTSALLSLIGTSGIVFGEGGDQQFKQQVADQFDQKRDAYCHLFDSKCLSKESPRKRLSLPPCSLHDLVKRLNGWSMDYKTVQRDGNSQISVIFKPTNDYCSNGNDSVEFIFIEFPDGWKLVAIPYA